MQILSCDQLNKLSEDELKSLFVKVRSYINTSKRENKNARDVEIYYCYIVRELESRLLVQDKY